MSSIKKSIIYSSISQIMRYAAPLIVYPVLVRTLGVSGFGQFSTILATGMVCAVFVEFGYGLMSVRELTDNHKNVGAEVVKLLIYGRFTTLVFTGIFLSASTWLGYISMNLSETVAALSIAIAYGMSASWYYISVESTGKLASIDLLCSLVTFLFIIIGVDNEDDYLFSIYMFSLPLIIASIIGHLLSIQHYKISSLCPKGLLLSLKESFNFFLFTGFPSISNRWGIIALSIWSSPIHVVYYSAAEKLATAAINTTVPICRVLLPRVNKIRQNNEYNGVRFLKRIIIASAAFYFSAAIICIFMSKIIMSLIYGDNLRDGYFVLSALMAMVPFAATSRVLVQVGLVPFGRERIAAVSSVIGTVIFVILTYLGSTYGAEYVAVCKLIIEFILLSIYIVTFLQISKIYITKDN